MGPNEWNTDRRVIDIDNEHLLTRVFFGICMVNDGDESPFADRSHDAFECQASFRFQGQILSRIPFEFHPGVYRVVCLLSESDQNRIDIGLGLMHSAKTAIEIHPNMWRPRVSSCSTSTGGCSMPLPNRMNRLQTSHMR